MSIPIPLTDREKIADHPHSALNACPITNLLEHSLAHEGETFEQLAARRAGNIEMMQRLVLRLSERAPSPADEDLVMKAESHLFSARRALESIATRSKEVCCNAS